MNKKNKIIVFGFIFIFAMIAFAFVNQVRSEGLVDIVRIQTERIYKNMICHDFLCDNRYPSKTGKGESEELFTFYGYDANCDDLRNECTQYMGEDKERCIHYKTIICREKFPYGQSGSMKIFGDMSTNGQRTYLDGYNNFDFHWFKTGLTTFGSKAIGFRKNTKNIYFNNDVYQFGYDNKVVFDYEGSNSNKIEWEDEGGNYSTFSNEYISIGASRINFHSENENIMDIEGARDYDININNGLEINNSLKTGGISWFGDTGAYRTLLWSPLLGMDDGYPDPSRENKRVLFYCEPHIEAGSCP